MKVPIIFYVFFSLCHFIATSSMIFFSGCCPNIILCSVSVLLPIVILHVCRTSECFYSHSHDVDFIDSYHSLVRAYVLFVHFSHHRYCDWIYISKWISNIWICIYFYCLCYCSVRISVYSSSLFTSFLMNIYKGFKLLQFRVLSNLN